jgi:hypothetical protein
MATKEQLNCCFFTIGCQQGKVDKKSSPPKVQLKNGTTFLYGNKKVDSKYFEVKI